MKTFGSFLASAIVLALVLAGCDAAGSEETIVLNNANSEKAARPTVEYVFAYQTRGSESIGIRSTETDALNDVLATVGFSRSDVVSASVDSVRLERLSPKHGRGARKVFDYLSGATLYLGMDAAGRRIADAAFETTRRSVSLQVVTSDVTDVVKGGPTTAFLQLDTVDDVPDRTDRVEVTVYFEIKVRGG